MLPFSLQLSKQKYPEDQQTNKNKIEEKMLPKSIKFLLIVLAFSTMQANGARRKSKVDSPIAQAAEAPLTDNIATASGSEPQVIVAREPAPPAAAAVATDRPAAQSTVAASSSSSSSAPSLSAAPVNNDNDEECDTDMVGFEIITG